MNLGVKHYFRPHTPPTSPGPFLSLGTEGKGKEPNTLAIMRNQLGIKPPLSKVMPHSACYSSGTALH